jgi:squalene synthase HpnC
VSGEHYENFPVASWLCPPALRPAVLAIYGFARTADDIADEGDAAPHERLEALHAFRADLARAASGGPPSPRWPDVFAPLVPVIRAHALPVDLLAALLDAFEQDVVVSSYADRDELMAYCRRSADPVGRLLLHLYGIHDPNSLARSDAICTALQLANFWQDLGIDAARGRLYVPESDCRRFGVQPAQILAMQDSPELHALVLELVAWTRSLMLSGAPLVHAVPGRAGLELRLVVQGGLGILRRIEGLQGATLRSRPVLGWRDAPSIVWRAATMRAGRSKPALEHEPRDRPSPR